jgi:hypothetical protein
METGYLNAVKRFFNSAIIPLKIVFSVAKNTHFKAPNEDLAFESIKVLSKCMLASIKPFLPGNGSDINI